MQSQPHRTLAASFNAPDERPSQRIEPLWPNLDDQQPTAIRAQTTEDGLRALLDVDEAGRRQPIHRTVFAVEVFSEGPYQLAPATDWLTQTAYDSTDGRRIGNVEEASTEVVPPGQVGQQPIRFGNDGTFDPDQQEGTG
jgi:hypothetical protein